MSRQSEDVPRKNCVHGFVGEVEIELAVIRERVANAGPLFFPIEAADEFAFEGEEIFDERVEGGKPAFFEHLEIFAKLRLQLPEQLIPIPNSPRLNFEGGGRFVDVSQCCCFHVDVDADAEKDLHPVFFKDCFAENAGEFFATQQHIIGPFDLGVQAFLQQDLGKTCGHDLGEADEVHRLGSQPKAKGRVDVHAARRLPGSLEPAAPCGLLFCRDAGDFVFGKGSRSLFRVVVG